MIIVSPREIERYLRWRLCDHLFPVVAVALDKAFRVMGTDPVLVNDDGTLSSPGGRGAPTPEAK